jgi:predicted dehydrogenase
VCQHFLDCIRSGDAPIADGWAGLATVEVLEAMDKSLAENGRPVTLEGAST